MEYTTLGKTGLRVGVAGLGCGGFSQLGLAQGRSEVDAIAIIRQALELGVNLFDTAAAYGTEEVLGKAIKSARREEVSSPVSTNRCGSSIPTTSTSISCTGCRRAPMSMRSTIWRRCY